MVQDIKFNNIFWVGYILLWCFFSCLFRQSFFNVGFFNHFSVLDMIRNVLITKICLNATEYFIRFISGASLVVTKNRHAFDRCDHLLNLLKDENNEHFKKTSKWSFRIDLLKYDTWWNDQNAPLQKNDYQWH